MPLPVALQPLFRGQLRGEGHRSCSVNLVMQAHRCAGHFDTGGRSLIVYRFKFNGAQTCQLQPEHAPRTRYLYGVLPPHQDLSQPKHLEPLLVL